MDEEKIATIAMRTICSRAGEVLASRGFSEIPEALLVELLSRDEFYVMAEMDVYTSVKRCINSLPFLQHSMLAYFLSLLVVR